MRIFHWHVLVGREYLADGYLLAENREEAEKKLEFVPYHDKHERLELDDDDCGSEGCEINEHGIAIRWQ